MKSLYESILSKSDVGLEAKVRKWLEEYTDLASRDWELDKKGFINIPETSLVFIEGAEKLQELPKFIRFGEVGGGVYSRPRCHWKSFDGFPHTLGTNTSHGISKGRFIMTTDSTILDYMPEIVKKDPHAKYPIEIRFENGLNACSVDIPDGTKFYLPSILEKDVESLKAMLQPHVKGTLNIDVQVIGSKNDILDTIAKELVLNKNGIK